MQRIRSLIAPRQVLLRSRRLFSELNQRELDTRSALGQTKHKLYHLGLFLTRPTRLRAILIMFGGYLLFAYSMYNWKTKLVVEEQKVRIAELEGQIEDTKKALVESDLLPSLEKKIRSGGAEAAGLDLRNAVRKALFPTAEEKDSAQWDMLTAGSTTARDAEAATVSTAATTPEKSTKLI